MLRHIYRIFHRSPWGKQSKKRKFLRCLCIAGFTFLELAIVIQIIGLLAVIVLSNFYKSKKAAEVAVVVQNVKNVQTALASYLAMAGKYPDTLNPIWLQFYAGNVVEDLEYIGGATAGNQGGWNFFVSHNPNIQFNGIGADEYALKSKDNLLPYALYIYGDVSTVSKIVH